MSPLLLYLLVCLSMHACNARNLGLIDNEIRKQLFPEDAENANINKASMKSKVVPPIFDAHDGLLGAISNMKQLKDEEPTKVSSSGHNLIVSSPCDLRQATKIQGYKGQKRSILVSAGNDAKEAIESKENEIVEDIEEMDYAQPHHRPPIHNLKP